MKHADFPPLHETGDLIDHILSRYHNTHRTELAALQPLAQKVEIVHADDPAAPIGLARTLANLAQRMEDHMMKEELILFPAMRANARNGIENPISVMRRDHDEHAEYIEEIKRLTADLTPPDHACGSWRALCAGTQKLLDDLTQHIVLENDMLFPRFERNLRGH